MITQERLKQLLEYDPKTGRWIRLVRVMGIIPGKSVGWRRPSDGRLYICIDRKLYLASRLAWLYMHGRWPAHEIDHVNCDASDDRLSNLREATSLQQKGNARRPSHNRSGHKGVYQNKHGNWYAQISKGNKQVHLGTFRSHGEAVAAYMAAATQYFGEFARIE